MRMGIEVITHTYTHTTFPSLLPVLMNRIGCVDKWVTVRDEFLLYFFFFGWSWLVGFPGPHSAGMITGGWRRRILLVESLGLLGGSAFELNKP